MKAKTKLSKLQLLKKYLRRAKQFYPQSRDMRKAWVRQTLDLVTGGSHILQTGRFKNGRG